MGEGAGGWGGKDRALLIQRRVRAVYGPLQATEKRLALF